MHLYKDYFDRINPLYKEKTFRRRYRMFRVLFMVILNGVRDYNDYFETMYDCTDKIGFSSYQKCFAALGRMWSGCLVCFS
jgi:hypothetical protein